MHRNLTRFKFNNMLYLVSLWNILFFKYCIKLDFIVLVFWGIFLFFFTILTY